MRELIILCFTILFLPLSVAAEGTGLKVEGGTPGTDYKYEDNTCTILKSTSLTISGMTMTDNIVVGEGVKANITIDGISIDLSNVDGKSAIDLKENTTLSLTLANASTLISGKAVAGIHLSDGSCLTITEESNGHSLTVTGGENNNDNYSAYAGAGIGKNPQEEGNATLKIEGGEVTANGGRITASRGISGDGIGRNVKEGLSHLTIDISGGSVMANGGDEAWMGYGGNGINGIVHIKGGNVTAKGKDNSRADIIGNTTVEGGIITDCTFGGEVIIKSGTFTDCTLKREITVKNGTFTNCTFDKIISFDETNTSFSDCNLTFTNPVTLTKDYSGCTFNGEITIKSGKFTNSTFTGEITVKNGTFTNCIFDGKVFLYNGSSTGNSSVKGSECYIYDGNWSFNNNQAAINSSNVNIYGGSIKANGASGAGIGGNNTQGGNNVTIYGGYVIANSGNGAGIGGGDGYSWGGQGGTTIIYGGTVVATGWHGIGSGRANRGSGITKIYGGSIKGTIDGLPRTTDDQPVYLGKLEVQNVTDVSVDGKPYYIDQNIDGDNNLYLYMTGSGHTVTVRTSGSNDVTTYNATYVLLGVDNDGTNKGYFTFDTGSSTSPTDNSSVAFDLTDYNMIYGTDKLIVTLTVNKLTRTRSAAMNSVQLVLTDGTTVLLSDQKEVTGEGNYKFEFDTKNLNTGSYTLTAQYGGSSENKISDKVKAPLIIAQAEGTEAPEYEDPTLTAIYKDKLSDIQLPTGWTWNVADTKIEVGTVGEKIFAAVFTPKDTKNYKVVSKNLSVTVNPAPVTNLDNPQVISTNSITYGVTLSKIEITNGWKWVEGNTIPEVRSWDGYPAYYEIEDDTNYDWTNIDGYDKNQHRVIRNIKLTVLPIYLKAKDFIFTPPENLIYDGQDKEAKVEVRNKDLANVSIYIYYHNIDNSYVFQPKDLGTYTVSIYFFADNYRIEEYELTDPSWTFTIKEQHNITIDHSITNGTVTANKEKAIEGETVTLTVSPDKGYELESLSCKQSDGTIVPITNKTFIMPESDVTVTATFKKATVTPPDPVDPDPVDPDPVDPDPSPVYYTVTLPAIEGAMTDPVAGSYEIESWGNFGFFLMIEEGYKGSSVPVVTADGKVITPRISDGKYILKNVQSDMGIEISGIVKDQSTGNVPLPSGFGIFIADGILRVTAPYATRLYLADTSGRLILTRQLPAGDTRIEGLAAGIYLLTLEGQPTRKILLK
ncbi:hypothetical protein [uncultured Parabacteroides sp.]|uniref:InlB B-repeat-containing protein n=1 Tax=uncultured Parabacteroides sp. TaxID=512312 RepID=UPI00259B6FC1|nr:hypothetical protein [uncultured Parabacteroides sp.]